jgi:pyruvate-ferredoxin/flavodoxin oxidoreductase
MATRFIVVDGNEAAASVAYRLSELIAVYPITPASPMGERADEWAAGGRRNLFGAIPEVIEMQSEAGAAAVLHGALQGGALATTFTASQGLLLMLPELFKIAGELTGCAIHVASRAVAAHALSIFGDHSDVMAARGTGFALLCAANVQEAQDMAAVAHVAAWEGRVPFLHFFDGFRTSHEVQKIAALEDESLASLLRADAIEAHRARALTPEAPVLRGTSQNPDAFFPSREAANPFYDALPAGLDAVLARFAAITGRAYEAFEYRGHPEAERVLVAMGSASECAEVRVEARARAGERVGLLRVRLFRPFCIERFVAALPITARAIAVLDRAKEPGASGDPLALEVSGALLDARTRGLREDLPRVIAGRYGLGSREFSPPMVDAVLGELERVLQGDARAKTRFTVGVRDDVTRRSLTVERDEATEPDGVVSALFYGLGSDGTVSSNKSSLALLGERTDRFVQGSFVYDSRKAGAMTVSHLRVGRWPIRAPYEIAQADFIAVHDPGALARRDVLARAKTGATVLLNLPGPAEGAWDALPLEIQRELIARRCALHVIDAARVGREAALAGRIGTVMQACFLALSGLLARDEAIAALRAQIARTWGPRGPEVLRRNLEAVDRALAALRAVPIPDAATGGRERRATVPADAPAFVRDVTAMLLEGRGEELPVSVFSPDGTWPVGTARYERRALATEVPVWVASLCVQCNKCAIVCPHAAIRVGVLEPSALVGAPEGFETLPSEQGEGLEGLAYAVQLAPDDCTGCGLCVEACPAKDKHAPGNKALRVVPAESVREKEREKWAFFSRLPEVAAERVPADARGAALLPTRFEFSGACAGCGETPYIRLLTQLFGDRMVIANATGCSSIYGGNLPTTPYTTDARGRGPAWNNSLFEDAAEFGLGIRLSMDARERAARDALRALAPVLDPALVDSLESMCDISDERAVRERRESVAALCARLARLPDDPRALGLAAIADALVPRAVWVVGGDGWAYDIGYGGLDHVLASGRAVKVLVLDTEVYSNTGGQQSKATPLGASAKFAVAGKSSVKKDLGLLAMSCAHAYVASVGMQANAAHATRALREAMSFDGPALILAHAPCVAHGYDLVRSLTHQRRAIDSWAWPLYRFDPRRGAKGEPMLALDSAGQKLPMRAYMEEEARFRMVELRDPARYHALVDRAQRAADARRALYAQLAGIAITTGDGHYGGGHG